MTEWYGVEGFVETPDGEVPASDRLRSAWSDAPTENLELCGMILDVARGQVIAFAEVEEPEDRVTYLLEELGYVADTIADVLGLLDLEPPAGPPDRFVYAQLQQAKNLWNAGRASGEGTVGADGFQFTPRPLDKTIQRVIRPTSGTADVF